MQSDNPRLPPLREDLELIPGEINSSGEKTFIVRDIRANRYIRIGADTFRILANWKNGSTIDDFHASLLKIGILIDKKELEECLKKIIAVNLVQEHGASITEKIIKKKAGKSKNLFNKFIHNYLFFKIPLFYPDRFIKRTLFLSDIFFSATFLAVSLCLAVVAIFFLIPQIDRLKSSFLIADNFEITFKFAIAISISKMVHELSHAYAAARKSCHVGSIGIGFIVGAPVFYADVTDSWRLINKKDRMIVAASGVISEIILAIYATIIWLLNINSFFNDVALYLAAVTWITTLAINANPLVRFDGYHLLSDFIGIKNLQQKAFLAVNQKIRAVIFGFPLKRIEGENILLIYGIGAIIYRIIVITGIALLLYHFVFRVLGIFLFLVEIWIFLLKPVFDLLSFAWKNRRLVGIRRVQFGIFLIINAVGLVLFLPLDLTVTVPAIMTKDQAVGIFEKYDSAIVSAIPDLPMELDEGSVIGKMGSPFRDLELSATAAEIETLRIRYERISLAPLEKDLSFTLLAEMERAKSKKQQILQEINGSVIIAPFKGRFYPRQSYKSGEALANKTFIGTLTSEKDRIIAFIPEKYLSRVEAGMFVKFVDAFDIAVVPGKVIKIENYAVERIKYPQITSTYGGPIKVHGSIEKGLISEEAIYRVIIQPDLNANVLCLRTGYAAITTRQVSLSSAVFDAVARVFVREAHID